MWQYIHMSHEWNAFLCVCEFNPNQFRIRPNINSNLYTQISNHKNKSKKTETHKNDINNDKNDSLEEEEITNNTY